MKIVLTIVCFAAVAFISCNSSDTTKESPKGLIVASDTAKAKYQCPMKCEGDTAYTTEGKCPVCKMDLEKK
jgi:protein SCO1/2